jgi:hypothetical protein
MSDYNPTEAQRLIAEARDDDARMVRAPWSGDEMIPTSDKDCAAIARTRNNLPTLADQLEAAGREVERLKARPLTETLDGMRLKAADATAERDSLRVDLRDANDTLALVRKVSIERGQEADSLRQQLEACCTEHEIDHAGVVHCLRQAQQLASERAAALRAIYPVYRATAEWQSARDNRIDGSILDARISDGGDDSAAIRRVVGLVAAEESISGALDTARAAITPEILAALERAGLEADHG